ncbi:1,4-alpha-glucan branching enzyme [Nitrosococcus halophilus Nc 4]|uniref:1,4-alpha-glucan branching enzyme GlgB n=1 Tax=Nitrosococcus halophilus (strain Nc4) TaxID=472759 RepID=D5BVZ5_NITHN|nr:1,4-alpha-glucan branching protein GlgB [Nitrosococcus halophilus]ADE15574.1 1,4-alpha-glucan branching enzyme [Nitrosococcus halophilus Nc 4]
MAIPRGLKTAETVRHDVSLLTEQDVYFFKEGTHTKLYHKLGAHLISVEGVKGTYFALWVPNAERVSVIGDFNQWNSETHALKQRPDSSGIWEGFIPGVSPGTRYKYRIVSKYRNYQIDKGDPFAFFWEAPPQTASRVWSLDYEWGDGEWMARRHQANSLDAPLAIYEVHLGSWQRVPEEDNRSLTYREMAEKLAEYVKDMGFTHVELLPVTEHPFYGSWGYQTTGYFAPTARYGTPQDFMYLVDHLHQNGIGVILDWVPSHFPNDAHGLTYFDGTYLFEHADPKKGFHREWSSYIFNYDRHEVRAFLMSSALFWLEQYHIDGIRVDAVSSILYLDYGRQEGEWIPNEYGGRENLAAICFLRELNEAAYGAYPDIQTIAEESTAWPMVSRPSYVGGLGFGMKWNMGWMHDTLDYFSKDSIFRKYHHDQLTFSIWYAFSENFVLALSHDEVVYGKGSLFGRMSGDEWQKFANLRVLFGYMYGHPGKKLLFMGGEFAQGREWNHDQSLDWHLLQNPPHQGVQRWVSNLNHFYRAEPALYEQDFVTAGFEWIDCHAWEESIISFIRKDKTGKDMILVVCNFTPVLRTNYRIGVPRGGDWREALNSDSELYGGVGHGNFGGVEAVPFPAHGRANSLMLTVPPLSVLFFKNQQLI